MTPGISLDAVDAGLSNLARQRRDFARDQQPRATQPTGEGAARHAAPATPPDTPVSPSLAPTAAFAAGLISQQVQPHDVLLDRQRLLDFDHTLPERGELPLTDRLV